METITLTIRDIGYLKSIQKNLKGLKMLPIAQQSYLYQFLSQIPTSEEVLLSKVGNTNVFPTNVWDIDRIGANLSAWQSLFSNAPGVSHECGCYFVRPEAVQLLRENVILIVPFAPSLSYHANLENEPCEVRLKDDGTASFWLPTLDTARQYPHLFTFTGSWQEAYLLLIETVKMGWPMEPVPEELEQFLNS